MKTSSETQLTYQIRGQDTSHDEARAFVEEYRKSIFGAQNRFPSRYVHILEFVGSGHEVLDYGCGWGCLARELVDQGNRVVAIDQDSESLKVARAFNSVEGVVYQEQNITAIEPESLGVVVSTQVLEHVHNPGIYLMECNKVLRLGGRLIISIPNVVNLRFIRQQLSVKHKQGFSGLSNEVLESYDKTNHHIQAWDPKAFVRLNASLGLKYLNHRYTEGTILPWGRQGGSRWPIKKYWHTRMRRVSNLSYTMMFEFEKVKYVPIAAHD